MPDLENRVEQVEKAMNNLLNAVNHWTGEILTNLAIIKQGLATENHAIRDLRQED